MNILVTNDDGIESASLPLLLKRLEPLGRVLAVVPDRERSGASHSITLHRPLRLMRVKRDVYTLDGTPTDCVNIVLLKGLRIKKIDLVISGINRGPNLSEDVFYSGTVAGAREGALFGIPSMAVSLDTMAQDPDFSYAAGFVADLVRKKRPERTKALLNINIPDRGHSGIRGLKITRLGNRQYKDVLIKRADPWNNPYFWLAGQGLTYDRKAGTDYYEVRRGYISITPLSLDITEHGRLEHYRKLFGE